METAKEKRRIPPPAWSLALLGGVPLWLFSLAIMAEGFPRPPISVEWAIGLIGVAIAASLGLVLKRWMTLDLLLCSLVPLALLSLFDEISTAYKSPFILVCALLLTAGVIGYQSNRSARWRALILLVAAVATLILASHAASAYWKMTSALGYERCFPGASGCPPLPANAPAWWALFFGF
jgi:hypothetical protein